MKTPHAASRRSGAAGDRPDPGVTQAPGRRASQSEDAEPAGSAEATEPASPPRRQRPARPMFGTTVLWGEVFVVFFAVLVAYGLRVADPTTLGVLGGVGMVVCAVAARLQRTRAGIVLGSGAQVVLLLGGFVLPTMFAVGIVFSIIWVLGVWLGLKIDRERAEREAHTDTTHSATEGNG